MTYFQDRTTLAYFILVYEPRKLKEQDLIKVELFLQNLRGLGLKTESEPYGPNPKKIFVKIHVPDGVVYKFAELFDTDISCKDFDYRPQLEPPYKCLATPLTNPDENDPVYKRAPESVSGIIPTKITSAEKIMIISQILSRVRFGYIRGDFGIKKMLKHKWILCAYPLHDGPYEWTEYGPLNDRQLLTKYWGCASACLKTQPLNLIEKYYGTEIALYFAWLGFYIKMLIPAAILSIVVVIWGLCTMSTQQNTLAAETCNSTLTMCPRCHYKRCKPEFLKNSCMFAHISYLFDNITTVIFGAFMGIWSTIFMEFFQRTQFVLQLQWNVRSLENDTTMRPEFADKATYERLSSITGETMPFMTPGQTCMRFTVTVISLVLLLLIMVLAMFLVMVYRVAVNLLMRKEFEEKILADNIDLLAAATASLISAIFICIFAEIYEHIAVYLTNLENHRTFYDHTNAFIYKSYALAFVNNYSAVFYIAFFKGRFYTYPGDIHLWGNIGGIGSDTCNYTGCIVDLSVLLLIIMTVKCVMSNVMQVVVPKLKRKLMICCKKIKVEELKDYEKEYLLPQMQDQFIVGEYMDMVIQYGFVTFFVVGFPLAPFFALCNNLSEIRVDASKISKSYKRPVPNRVVGLGAWFAILQAMTYIGSVINALVIAFTSHFIDKQLYNYIKTKIFTGDFTNYSTSVFLLDEFNYIDTPEFPEPELQIYGKYCVYHSQRNPPHDPHRYEHRTRYWKMVALKFAVVVIFENVLLILKGILAYAIPDVPVKVQEQVSEQQKKDKKYRNQMLKAKYMGSKRNLKQAPLKMN